MLSIIWRQIKKYKYVFFSLLLIWILGGLLIYNYRYTLISQLYLLFSNFPEWGKPNPQKAYDDFVKPAIEIIENNKINLQAMQELCPSELKSNILYDSESNWTFLKKYTFYSFDAQYITLKNYDYWMKNKPYVLESIRLLNEAQKYAFEIPEEVSKQKNILLPLLIEQLYFSICLPNESKKYWKRYIDFLEEMTYKEIFLKNQNQEIVLPFARNFDLDLLKHMENHFKYIYAIKSYIGGIIPYSLIQNCKEEFICKIPEEGNFYINKLIFVSPRENLGNLFLSQARIYIILAKKYREEQTKYLKLALERYYGALDYPETRVEAFLEMAELYLSMDQPDKALITLQQFAKEKPSKLILENFYHTVIHKTLISLKRYEEAECFKEKYLRSPECNKITKQF